MNDAIPRFNGVDTTPKQVVVNDKEMSLMEAWDYISSHKFHEEMTESELRKLEAMEYNCKSY